MPSYPYQELLHDLQEGIPFLAVDELEDGAGVTHTGELADRADVYSQNVVATGSVTLSSGAATVDTGVPTTETATLMVAIGPATDDADISGDVRSDSTSGNYEVDLQETDTAVGNPTVEYDIIRVR